ncbi:MAG: PEP-CTERM sorting domain-containing protein [Planctomycetota bacterium]
MAVAAGPEAEAAIDQDGDEPAGPEPATLLIAGAGLVGLAFSARRLRRGVPAGH